ncbi:preprotein translocase, SecG subunit [Mycoplasma synoviae GX11-T]|nr:preprotein translocase subunit SecG [Mycoplasmopsis synoviae]MBD5788579.1 preprotein translocase, SecG subunit [Mycoplasmopsis synoviae GX11-T]
MLTLIIFLVLIGVCVMIVSLLMSPDSNSFSGALVGSSDLELFKVSKERGIKKFLKYFMFFLGISLILGAILLKIYV